MTAATMPAFLEQEFVRTPADMSRELLKLRALVELMGCGMYALPSLLTPKELFGQLGTIKGRIDALIVDAKYLKPSDKQVTP